ncbi:MAG: sulfite exporter TauE/SafE family protein, partial [Betaproteobacteria bacterium]|nr:sulfite exporter TauE/SafE family protein [Betaproteobacteria bacterium]
AAGAFVGFLAGLLGIGGGMTLVPILAALFAAQSFGGDHTVHLALATAMASAAFTSSASVKEHHKHGAVDWELVRRFVPAMVTGSLIATFASGWVSQRTLALSFAVIVFGAAINMIVGKKPTSAQALPGSFALFALGVVIGAVSGLVSAGGTFLLLPVMLYCGVTMHTAIGTGAAIGIPVTAIGTLGYIAAGWRVPGLPDPHLGFVYLPALAGLVIGSLVTAPMGARAAHRLPVAALKRVFALLMIVLAARMAWRYF